MKKGNKKNKKGILIILIVLVVIFGGWFLISKVQNQKDLKLSCTQFKSAENDAFKVKRDTKVYSNKEDDSFYYDKIEIEINLDDEEQIQKIKSLYRLKFNRDYISFKEEPNKIVMTIDINLSEQSEEMVKLLALRDITVDGIKQSLEESGMTCEKY